MRTTIYTITYKDDHTLAYADCGDPRGFPVLVQHGMVASIRDTAALYRRLIHAGRRVICAARPGYGASSPYALHSVGEWGELLRALADALGLEGFDVLGISSGAPYAYAAAAAMPRRARSVYILSGIPALYDEGVRALWPYPDNHEAGMEDLQKIAYEVFFSGCSPADRAQDDVSDSMQNYCFGPALDLHLRCCEWGFTLADVRAPVVMRHSRADGPASLQMAEMTARMFTNCRLEVRENDPHFSPHVLDDFIKSIPGNFFPDSSVNTPEPHGGQNCSPRSHTGSET